MANEVQVKVTDKDGNIAYGYGSLGFSDSQVDISVILTTIVEGGIQIQIKPKGIGVIKEYCLTFPDLSDTIYPSQSGSDIYFDSVDYESVGQDHWAYRYADCTVLRCSLYGNKSIP
jgi:hypothetical protein